MNTNEIIDHMSAIVANAEADGRDLSEAEEKTIELFSKTISGDEPADETNPEILEETNMNAPLELKTIELPAEKELSLVEQITKALPSIQRGESFKTELKAISGPNTDSTGGKITTPAQWAGLFQTTLPVQNRLYSLVRRIAADGQSVSYARVGLGDNKAAKVKELALKPNSEMVTTTKTLTVETFAHWTEASNQLISDVSGVEALIGGALIEGLIRVVDAHIYSTLVTNAWPFAPSTTGSDVFAEASLQLQQLGATNTVIAVNPADYLKAITAKSTQGEYIGLTPYAVPNLVACPSVPQGSLIGFDTSAVAFFDRMAASIFIGTAADQFTRNAVTVLAETRGVAAVLNQNLVLTATLPVPKV